MVSQIQVVDSFDGYVMDIYNWIINMDIHNSISITLSIIELWISIIQLWIIHNSDELLISIIQVLYYSR